MKSRIASPAMFLVGCALCVVAGCDSEPERPVTLAERVAGTWELSSVRDGGRAVTNQFGQQVGAVELKLESVGCCADRADYRLTVTGPEGEVFETQAYYLANDSPNDSGDFIYLLSDERPITLVLIYAFNSAFTRMTLTSSGSVSGVNESLVQLGIDLPFQEQAVFVFDKLN